MTVISLVAENLIDSAVLAMTMTACILFWLRKPGDREHRVARVLLLSACCLAVSRNLMTGNWPMLAGFLVLGVISGVRMTR